MASWVQVAVSHKNDQTFSKTLLLNTAKVGEIKAYSSSYAEFFYADYGDKTTKYRCSALTKDELVTLVTAEQVNDNRIELPILGKSIVKRNKLSSTDLFDSATVYNVELEQLIDAWDIGSTSTAYARFQLGDKFVLYKVNDTIANMESASSTSVSIA
jgi:hypothetical protein